MNPAETRLLGAGLWATVRLSHRPVENSQVWLYDCLAPAPPNSRLAFSRSSQVMEARSKAGGAVPAEAEMLVQTPFEKANVEFFTTIPGCGVPPNRINSCATGSYPIAASARGPAEVFVATWDHR